MHNLCFACTHTQTFLVVICCGLRTVKAKYSNKRHKTKKFVGLYNHFPLLTAATYFLTQIKLLLLIIYQNQYKKMVAVLFIPHIYKNGNTFFPSTKLFSVAAPAEIRRRSLERGRLLPNTHSKGALVRKGRFLEGERKIELLRYHPLFSKKGKETLETAKFASISMYVGLLLFSQQFTY